MFPSWVSVEPRLLPLARRNGFGNADDWHEMVLKRIFSSSIQQLHPPEGEAAHVAKVILELTELDPAMYGGSWLYYAVTYVLTHFSPALLVEP